MQTVEKKGGICSKLTINMLGGNWLALFCCLCY